MCFKVFAGTGLYNWTDAESACVNGYDGELMSIHNAFENALVTRKQLSTRFIQ